MSGDIVKLRNQFNRSRKFADWIQKESSLQEFADAIRLRPETDYWTQIALVLGIDPPSEVTQLLTLCVLEDRASEVIKARELLTKFHKSFPPIKDVNIINRKQAKVKKGKKL